MIRELGDVFKQSLIDICKLFRSTCAVWLNERLDIIREDAKGQYRVRRPDKSNSTASAVQVKANMHEELSVHLNFRKLKSC